MFVFAPGIRLDSWAMVLVAACASRVLPVFCVLLCYWLVGLSCGSLCLVQGFFFRGEFHSWFYQVRWRAWFVFLCGIVVNMRWALHPWHIFKLPVSGHLLKVGVRIVHRNFRIDG